MPEGKGRENVRYLEWTRNRQQQWENLCNRCGTCCGIGENDPCEHLFPKEMDVYECRIYENRFGTHKTISGREFECVPLRSILHKNWAGDHLCAYKKAY